MCPFAPAHDAIATKTQSDTSFNFAGRVGLIGAEATSTNSLQVMVANKLAQQRDLNVEVEVLGSDAIGTPKRIQWRYKFSDHNKFFGSAYIAQYHGVDSASNVASDSHTAVQLMLGGAGSGIFVWWDMTAMTSVSVIPSDRYFFNATWHDNSHFVDTNSDTAHQSVECAGRGTCNRDTGLCACDAGFEGDACQRRSCASGCSGHGVCLTMKRAAAEAMDDPTSYNSAWDSVASTTCQCDIGYRGPDCSMQECPSGPDPMGGFGGDGLDRSGTAGTAMDCSGRGTCDYSTGLCKCAKGFYGEACEKHTTFV